MVAAGEGGLQIRNLVNHNGGVSDQKGYTFASGAVQLKKTAGSPRQTELLSTWFTFG